jgi:hypothetical protein
MNTWLPIITSIPWMKTAGSSCGTALEKAFNKYQRRLFGAIGYRTIAQQQGVSRHRLTNKRQLLISEDSTGWAETNLETRTRFVFWWIGGLLEGMCSSVFFSLW